MSIFKTKKEKENKINKRWIHDEKKEKRKKCDENKWSVYLF